MKALLLAPLLLLCSCVATQGALKELNLRIEDATTAALAAQATAEDVNATQADVDASMALLAKNAGLAKEALVAVKDAAIEDVENAKGFTGLGGGADGGVIGLALTALAWFMRDRRKRLGQDPLQRADVKTPPTTA